MNEYPIENRYTLGEKELREVNHGKFKKGYIFTSVLIGVYGILSFYDFLINKAEFFAATTGFWLLAILFAFVIYYQEGTAKRFSEANIKKYGKDIEMCILCGDNIVVDNITEGIRLTIEYGELKNAYNTENFLVLLTKKNRQIILAKYGFTKGSLEALGEYISGIDA